MIRRSLFRLTQSSSGGAAAASSPSSSSRAIVDKSLQVAVIGSGPSGFYTADAIIKHPLTKVAFRDIHVDIFEELPVPYGLVRYGVAPDHPEVKNVEKKFREVATSPNVTWIGNMNVGRDIPVSAMLENYDAVVFATGAQESKSLGIPGEDNKNVTTAKRFVEWYNAHPRFGSHDMPEWDLRHVKDVVIIGNGNVSMDVARVLCSPAKAFAATDMCGFAIKHLWASAVKNVTMCARRGVFQSAFTIKEFREMLHIPHLHTVVPPFELPEGGVKERPMRRLMDLLHTTSKKTPPERVDRRFVLEYGARPVEITTDRVIFERMVQEEPNSPNFRGTGVTYTIPADLVVVSAGYRGTPIPGVPFDNEKGVIPNKKGAVDNAPGLFCSGWAKKGPKGVILASVQDAQETAQTVVTHCVEAASEEQLQGKYGLINVMAAKRLEYVTFKGGWGRIEDTEKEYGVDLGKSAEKVRDLHTMLSIAMPGSPGERAGRKFRGYLPTRGPNFDYVEDWLDENTCMIPPTAGAKPGH